MTVAFTDEQRAAIDDRAGSALLAANAGSGKTAVMAERCVEAVLRDGVPVGAILALTFTEKAAGELRERIRRRFLALGEEDKARDVDAGWIGTIHGFCARVLRSRPLAAGLDPRFEVLDEGAAERLAHDAYERAFEAWVGRARRARGRRRRGVRQRPARARARRPLDPALARRDAAGAARAAGCAAARSGGARRRARGRRAAPGDGRQRAPPRGGARRAGDVRARARRRVACPVPSALAAAELKKGSKALGEESCEGYRAAWAAYRQGCADHHARLALIEIAELLARFGAVYAEAKAARAGLDFEDLELGVRDLLMADPADRERWAERFQLIMVDEFQDTNRLQLDVLEALERDNLFAVGDEFQSIYGFRHADVTIFRERRAALGEGRVRPLTANFRSREELLDVLNGAFAPQWEERFAPLLAGARPTGPASCACSTPASRPTPSRASSCSSPTRAAGRRTTASGSRASRPSRTGAPRRASIAHRLRRELEAGRAARDIVVLVRATASLRLFEEALEEQGVPTYVVGGRGYWSQQPVRDGLAYLAALANPLDEEALLGVLASPFCGVGSDALILLAGAGKASEAVRGLARRGGVWPALRAAAGGARRPARGPAGRRARAAARVRGVLRRRARARRAAAGRGAARTGARDDRLRPRGARAQRRRAAAGEPAQADAAGARVRARRGPRPARLPRLRRHARPRRRARGRGAARVRGPRRGAADDDPPRQGARVPGRLRRRPRPPGRRAPGPAAARRRRLGRAAARHAGQRRHRCPRSRSSGSPRRRRRPRTPRSGGCSTSP